MKYNFNPCFTSNINPLFLNSYQYLLKSYQQRYKTFILNLKSIKFYINCDLRGDTVMTGVKERCILYPNIIQQFWPTIENIKRLKQLSALEKLEAYV